MSVPGGIVGPWTVAQAGVGVTAVVTTLLAFALAVPFVLVGAGVAVVGGTKVRTGLRMRRTDFDTAADAADGGQVTLAGTVRPVDGRGTVTAPLSGEECLAYDYGVRRYRPSNRGASWRTMESGEEGVGFVLDCADGEVFVEADRDPEFFLSEDSLQVTVGANEDPPESVRRYLEREDTPDGTGPAAEVGPVAVGGQRRRYREGRLVPGESAFVAGVARDRTSATDRPVPRGVAAVVGPPDVSGGLDRLRRRWSGLPFLVADSPPAKAAGGEFFTGGILLLMGVFGTLFTLFGTLLVVALVSGLFLLGG